MDKYLAMVPKNLLAFLAIAGGILFIILSQPPHTICESQMEVLKKSSTRFLFRNAKSRFLSIEQKMPTTLYEKLRDRCQSSNTPGGCYEYFQELKKLLGDLSTMPADCGPAVASVKEYGIALKESAEDLVRLGWGEAPPASYSNKFGWLDSADISLFCHIKDRFVVLFGEDDWNNFRERMMRDLPGAKDLPRNQIWDLSIFSENCARYP